MSETQETQQLSPPDPAAAPPAPPSSTSSENASLASTATSPVTKPADSTRPSSLPKPSGLKPPSKIGRLCSNSAPKPAVPISPRTDGSSSDTLRKLSDDSSRKHLSDLLEAEEDEVSSSLPERPRTHRKASNHSVILTEDTDSFIIGERVWVGGTKPGQIAYIGETQFAPGDWAGIVLDEPIGKNDGSVAGVRYFQCPEKRGVFSRLTRLTRIPLVTHAPHDASPISDAGSVFERPPSGTRQRRALSPNGSIRSMVSSKMNASISTTTNGEVRVGDRVIVSSSRGSKAGTLRYVGVTDFATGVWAGVELDDPLGKNDGSVDGKRYFECSPRFGLFAPISKVSRSPSNRKPGACAIHSNGRATPLRRSNSRESLTSLGTSIASSRVGVRLGVTSLGAQRVGGPRASSTPVSAKNALQELLREKQQHLERLMRERELERAEMAKISLQANRAETALTQLKKEATQATSENSKLKSELDKINKLLEDEKQKVEDLMFRTEEENINREDYNKYKETMEQEKATREQRIRELEAEAELQTARAEATAAALRMMEDQRAADMAAANENHREELAAAHTLSSELQKLLDEAYALLKEKESEKDSLGKSMSEELTRLKTDSERALNEAKTKMAIAQTEFETQVSVLTAKLQLAESKLETEKQNVERLNKENSQIIIDLNTKLTQLQAAVDDKTLELNKVVGVSKEHEVNLNKEITKLKMELSAKVLDLEQLEDSKRKQETIFKSLQEELGRVKDEYNSKVNEYETLLSEVSQQHEKNKTDMMELQQSLSAKTKEYEKLLAELSTSTSSSEKLVSEYKQTIHERDKEIIKLKDDFEQTTANFNIKHSKIAEEHKKEIDDRNTKIEELLKEIESHKLTLDQSKVELEALNSQFILNVDELKVLKEENEKLKQTINDLTQANNDLKAKMSAMELEVGEYKRQYESANEKCAELQKAKDKIEEEYMNLTGQTTDSNEQFNKLSQHLKETEKELQELKDKHREVVNNHARNEQELKQKLFKIQEDFSVERGQLVGSVNDNLEKLKEADGKIKELEAHTLEINNRLRGLQADNDKLLDENTIFKNEIEALKVKEREQNSEHESICKKLEIDIDRYKEEISILKADGATSEVKLMEKVDQLTEAQNDLNNKLEEARKHEDSLQKILDDMTAQLNNQKSQFEKEITQLQTNLSTVSDEANKLRSEETHLKALLEEKQNNIKDLSLKLEMLEVDLKSNVEIVTEKDRQIALVNEELNKASENKKQLEEKLNAATLETSSLKQKYENLIANSSAEESILKEQLNQLEVLKKETSVLTQEKTSLESKYTETLSELTALKKNYEDVVSKMNANETVTSDLKKSLDEKDNLLKSQNEKHETDLQTINKLEADLAQLKQQLSSKEIAIQEKESQVTKMNEALQLGSSESQQLVAQLQQENAKLNETYKTEVESLSNTTKTLQSQLTEKDKELEDLKQTKEKLAELQNLVEKSEQDIKQLTNINEAQKLNYEDLNKQLQAQFDEHKKESKRARHELRNTIGDYEKELKESKEKVAAEIEKQNQLQQKLTDAENKILELTQKLELVAVQQSSDVEKDKQLEILTVELQLAKQSSTETVAKSETLVKNLKADIENKVKELRLKEDMISKLQEEVKNNKAKVEIVEREKLLLQKEMAAKGKDIRDNNDNSAMGVLGQGDSASEKVTDDKEMIDGQVSFLNSVIVDMQRKNEQLMARVQALEGGTVVSEPVLFNGRKARAVAPRLFCDICDVFDAHDTEDCPRQAGEPDAPPPPTNRRAAPPPRPYCDICEVFGHATENCDEEETF
ncbi:CAP-Gly domain-containing linker protein 1 isoform X3 [Spodoptera litura]|uniref:CAP-Gly domain-containing linker protein 1 isoform X3 n=1 Tax=Spodoptera litura TaxID=69820 RepID=A0A9J7E0F4_SPOLT|nr:CAP-Gly domain-containing linker protein 1 isoform X3 [Spodoptera litura]